jgi:hypothetical protein
MLRGHAGYLEEPEPWGSFADGACANVCNSSSIQRSESPIFKTGAPSASTDSPPGLHAHTRERHLTKHPRLLLERQRVPVRLRVALTLRPTHRSVFRSRRQSTTHQCVCCSQFRASKNGLVKPCARHDSNVRPLPALSFRAQASCTCRLANPGIIAPRRGQVSHRSGSSRGGPVPVGGSGLGAHWGRQPRNSRRKLARFGLTLALLSDSVQPWRASHTARTPW